MKARLQTSLGQHLVMTPQLRQAIRVLQMSSVELQAEVADAIESNPLLEWAEEAEQQHAPATEVVGEKPAETAAAEEPPPSDGEGGDWGPDEAAWQSPGGGGGDDGEDAAERMAGTETLDDHLLWQLHLSPLSLRDRRIGAMLIDALDDDGYLRESLAAIAESLLPEIRAGEEEILTVLHQLQRFDPVGVGARNLKIGRAHV